MDVEKMFHMKGGLGEASYFKNSSIQKNVGEKMEDITLKAIEETYLCLKPTSLGIADLGCSTGSNTLLYIKNIVDAVGKKATHEQDDVPEFRFCLNDLPTNDYNPIFQALPDLYQEFKKKKTKGAPISCCIGVYPGSFYGRLFPANSLHFLYSFSSLHWLSMVPLGIYNEQGQSLNKKSIYITKHSPRQVCEAYAKQFEQDFNLFLKSRSEEVVKGGRMVLVLTGRSSPDYFGRNNTLLWGLLYQALLTLVAKGRIKEELVESYEVHYYEPSREEIEHGVKKEASFQLDHLEMLEKEIDFVRSGNAIAKTVRAVQETMISHHFGETILDELFEEYGKLLDQEIMVNKESCLSFIDVAFVLRKL